MENESSTQSVQQQTNVTEEKKERVDELDIVGGALVKVVMEGFAKIKNLFSPKHTE